MANELILIVEDNIAILADISEYLQLHGYRVLTAEFLRDAAAVIADTAVDLILLDINMPDGSGLDFAQSAKQTSDTPVIFLTGRAAPKDIVEGLAYGDDYITKPFDFDVMLARINVQIRKRTNPPDTLKLGELTLDFFRQQAFCGDRNLFLSPKEFTTLCLLAQGRDKVTTAEELYQSAWDRPMMGNDSAVKTVISRLRGKLAYSDCHINSIRGQGYQLVISNTKQT